MWVPLIENGEYDKPGADYFVQQHLRHLLSQSGDIDTLLLACTHYPLLLDKIRQFLPPAVQVVTQGDIVAKSLRNYLERHPEMAMLCSRASSRRFFTTDDPADFERQATRFFGAPVAAAHTEL